VFTVSYWCPKKALLKGDDGDYSEENKSGNKVRSELDPLTRDGN